MSREEHQTQLDDLLRANRLIERDVRRIRIRNECLERIRYLKQKKSWMVTMNLLCGFLAIEFEIAVYFRFMRKHGKSICLRKKSVSVQNSIKVLSTTSSSHSGTNCNKMRSLCRTSQT